jgi:hypothetical protein
MALSVPPAMVPLLVMMWPPPMAPIVPVDRLRIDEGWRNRSKRTGPPAGPLMVPALSRDAVMLA